VSSGSFVAVLAGIGSSVLAFLCAPAIAFAQAPAPGANASTPLTFGVTLNTAQRADEWAAYSFAAEQGRTYLIEVEETLDLVVTIEKPIGANESFDSPLRRDGTELVLLEHTEPGTHRVILRSEEHTGAIGNHAIRVSVIGEADTGEVAALRLMSQGAARYREGGQTAWVAANDDYLAAAELWRALTQPRREAQAMLSAALIAYWHTRNRPRAAELAAEAAKLYADFGDEGLAARANHLQGKALVDMPGSADEKESHYTRALALFTQAAAVQTRLGRIYDLAFANNDIGSVYFYKNDWRNARRYLTEAATLFRSVNEWSGELQAVTNLGAVDFEEGYVEEAIRGSEHALALMPSNGTRQRADALTNLGVMQRVFGRFDEAVRSFSDSLAVGERLEDPFVIGKSLFGIGETYYSMGDLELAGEYLRAALPKRREAADQRGQLAVLRYLGLLEYSQTNYAAALELHQQALDLATAPNDKSLVEVLLAQDLAALGRFAEAARSANAAREIADAAGLIQLHADALEQLGRVQLADARPHEAEQSFEQAFEIYSAQALHGDQARALNGLALAARDTGELRRAVEYGERALTHIENVRGDIADPRRRAFYLAARHDYYDVQIDLTMRLQADGSALAAGPVEAAFALSERARARTLVDLLSEAHVDLAEPDPELAARRAELQASLGELRRLRDLLRIDAPAAASLHSVVDELAQTENQLNLLEAEARAANPKRSSLTAPQPLSAPELRAAVDADSVLLEYALGGEKSYVWVVTHESVRAVVLADRKTIEEAAMRVYDGLRRSNSGPALTQDLRRLADLVLTPVAPLLTKDRVLIAADGALQYVPFAVLPVVGADGAPEPLLRLHEIVGLPSLSVLASQRAGPRRTAASKAVAVFADPVFDRADPRVGQVVPMTHTAHAPLATRSSALSSGTLARLPFSAQEADVIARLVPESERYVAVGFEASRETVLGMDLGDYRVLHFATHGVIDTRYPDLSALALSGVDAAGAPTRSLLGLPDIYALHLNADVVVLSACETALGRDVRGEGLLGLTQGFLYAGTKSVVASLWPVADRATAELMQRFYQNMLRDGLRPADALRRAQLSIATEPLWRHPYYWSAFVMLGDWQ
jgi:CHAT domain-containing protein